MRATLALYGLREPRIRFFTSKHYEVSLNSHINLKPMSLKKCWCNLSLVTRFVDVTKVQKTCLDKDESRKVADMVFKSLTINLLGKLQSH